MDVIDDRDVENQDLEQRTRLAALTADVGLALTQSDNLEAVLQQCAQAVVDRLDGAFVRIWTSNDAERVLELRASAGTEAQLDEPHGRVPIGKFQVGSIAQERQPYLTNDVIGDSRVVDKAWAAREGMVAFAGYPLMIGDDVVGVLAMFARRRLGPADHAALESVAHGIALALARWRIMDRLRDSEARAVQRADALAKTTAELRRMNADLDAFAYAASHDLRAPLRGIANLAQWIEEDLQGSLSDETSEMLALLRTRMHRMESLIDGILQYSRAGRVHEPPEQVDVAASIEELVDLLAPESATIEIQGELPVFVTERVPLQQVFQNLLGNAIKHGGDGVTITVSAVDEAAHWRFVVADDGPGIAPEYHDRIWGIFQTLEPRDRVEGTGIGLSLVKKLVETQGGTVAVESQPGAGSAFSFTWPKNN